MRRFLVRGFLYFSFLLFLWGSICLVSWWKYHQIAKQSFVIPAGVEIVSVSDSHTQCGLAQEVWPEFKNFSSSGTAVNIWLQKVKWLCNETPHGVPQVLLLELGVHKQVTFEFAAKRDSSKWAPLFFDWRDAIPLQLEWATELPFRRIIPLFGSWKPYDDYPVGLGLGSVSDEKKKKLLAYTLSGHFSEENLNLTDECEQSGYVRCLEQIIDEANRHGTMVVFISTPCHADYRANVPERIVFLWKQTRAYLTEKYGIPHFNYWDYPLEDKDFRDHDHLSASGRLKLTAQFRKDFEYWQKERGEKD